MTKRDWDQLWQSHAGPCRIDRLGHEVVHALESNVPGWSGLSFLEAGAGTGTISLELARAGARVTMIDASPAAVWRIRAASQRNARVEFIAAADVRRLPFQDESFDVVWSSGVLEHFSESDLANVLSEMSRVSRKYVVSFVPNLNCGFYLLWSYALKVRGQWTVGYESPKASLRYAFENAGIEAIREFSIGFDPEDFLRVLPSERLRDHLAFHLRQLPPARREGYLLGTVGVKARLRASHESVEYTYDDDARFDSTLFPDIRWARAQSMYARALRWAARIRRRARSGR